MYYGDIALGDTIDLKFTSRRFTTGAPFTLAGSPVISAYVGNGTTEITAGITLSVDFDARTGLNNVRVVATGGNGFAATTNVQLVITTGTVDSVSVVGEVIGSFSISARTVSALAADVITAAAIANGAIDAATFAAGAINAAAVADGAIDAATFAAGAIDAAAIASNAITAAKIAADAITDAKVASDVTIASVTGSVGSIASGGITAASFAAGAIDAAAVATDAIGAVELAAGAASEVAAAVRTELTTELGRVDTTVSSRATPAQVNTEVLDVLNVDTFAEPGQEAPAATTTLVKKLGYLYKFLRNKKTQTATTLSLFADDASTVDQKATISDDATTYTHGEIATGP